ncbi:MAG TPA: inositol 2-dehydrogenase [Flexilinea sp.]|nr:inositol 2-dehydrogenase [Flexilinea sp.]
MNRIRVGIIGAGRIGRVHAQSIAFGILEAEIVAISDPFIENAERAARDFAIPAIYADYHAILNDPTIQAVLICSPTNTHADIAMEAARAGKHIFCEKPVDQTVSKILETKKLVEENAVKMQIGFNRRFDHNFRKIKKLRDDGTLGEIQIIRITSRDPEPPSPEYAKTSGGMFLDMTIHDFDMACYQANSEVDEVYAMGAVTVDPEIGKAGDIDTAIVTLKFKNGAMAVIDNCRKAVYGYDQRVEVFGTNGAAASENDRETMVKISSKDAVCEDKPLFFFLERYMQSFRDEIKSFINAILNDRPVEVNIDDGLRPILIAIAANKSMKENRPVKISEVMEG